ncbi:hypothetical protein EV714DRAFT_198405 [Schizophyllum commune]
MSNARQKKYSKSSTSSVKKYSFAFVTGGPSATATTQSLSSDRRRVIQKKTYPKPPSPVKRRTSRSQPLYDFGDAEDGPPDLCDTSQRAAPAQRRRRRRKKGALASDEPMRQFRALADDYMYSLMRAEGRDDAGDAPCPTCPDGVQRPAEYRCKDCFGGSLFCRECIVRDHSRRPFCRIQRWDGATFHKCSLQELGLCLRLGHPEHERCPCPTLKTDVVAIHVNGMHKCNVEFCGCTKTSEPGGSERDQLLRRGFFPATATNPQTFCTFEVLRLFHIVTLQGKVTAYDFYAALEKLTDMMNVEGWTSRYAAFLRCVRQWRFLKMMKLGGRGSDTSRRPTDFGAGELAVTCPACPQPGVNLPEGWREGPTKDQFLYTLFIAMDACFRLKRRKVSSWERDPSLVDGGAYMVESAQFNKFISGVGAQSEMSTCTGLSAIDHANTKYHKGYAETGKMLGLCARHEFLQRTGIVPTQVGERYANTDYAFASLLRHHAKELHIVLSYDICCQYSKQLAERLQGYQLPAGFRVDIDTSKIRFVIPKLHIHGHKLLCQLLFNFNWTCGCGRTDGEGVERPWAALGALGTSLRAMGPGSASDTLDDHGNFWNAVREVGIGSLTRRRLIDAFAELAVQTAELEEFRIGQVEHAEAWEAAVIAFENDNSQENPFEPPNHGASEADVALELATEEELRAREGLDSRHELSPSAFILALLDIENRQRTIRMDVASKRYTTTDRQTELARQRVKLLRAIARLRAVQETYTPTALHAQPEMPPEAPPILAEDQALFPPSALSKEFRAACLDDVAIVEQRLRHGQCQSALDGIRNLLLIKSRMLTYKNGNVRHQGPSTRAQALLAKNQAKIDLLAQKYIDARRALVRLADGSESEVPWPSLDPGKDIRCMEDPDDTRMRGQKRPRDADSQDDIQDSALPATGGGHLQQCRDATGEGRRTVSWIWKGVETDGSEGSVYQGIKVEYCKAFSRVRRWREEVALLQEEMRRTLETLEWKARQWDRREREDARADAVGEGARAYSRKRARAYRELKARFEAMWSDLRGRTAISQAEVEELRRALDREDAEGEDDEGAEVDGLEDEEGDSEEDDEPLSRGVLDMDDDDF